MMDKQQIFKMFHLQWIVLCVFFVSMDTILCKNAYYMDSSLDCGYIGVQPVNRDQVIAINGKSGNAVSTTQTGCTINFQASESDSTLELTFDSFIITNPNIKLYVTGISSQQPKVYDLTTRAPEPYLTSGRSLTLTLHKTDITSMDYSFALRLRAIRETRFPLPSDSNPMAVGLVIGIVGAVFGVIFIAILIGCCCFRKYKIRGSTKSPYLYGNNSKAKLDESHEVSVGYSNEMHKANSSPSSKKKLLSPSDSNEGNSHFSNGFNQSGKPGGFNRDLAKVPIPPPYTQNSGLPEPSSKGRQGGFGRNNSNNMSDGQDKDKAQNESGVDVDVRPKNPLLGALKGNAKFQKTFEETEADARDRAKRISSTDSFEKLGDAPTPPSSEEGRERPVLPPVSKSPKGRRDLKHAAISRAPRPSSMSSDEMAQIGQGLEKNSVHNVRGTRDGNTSSSSQSENFVPIGVSDQKRKTNTTHALRPDRKGKKSQQASNQAGTSLGVGREPEQRPNPRDARSRVQDSDLNDSFGSGRYKRGRKSPRLGRSSGGKGFSHRRGRSMDMLDSRPTTPTSMYGSTEDLESLPPLQRASSKNSLYASRSSLYDRRGRRRKGSYAESVTSYATTRDDMSVQRHSRGYDSYSDYEEDTDGYEKPLSRQDRNRLYRSENDLGRRNGKEIATQTLRETATQTGTDQAVVMQPKQLVKKKRRAKSVSTAETQTMSKKKGKGRSKSVATELDSDEKSVKSEMVGNVNKPRKSTLKKTKRSKSVDQLADAARTERPKPKPRPRKSTTADAHLEVKSKSASNLADMGMQPYYPQSDGFIYEEYMGERPTGAPPAYPGGAVQGQGQYPTGQYPGYQNPPGMQQGYPPYMHPNHPLQEPPPVNYAPQPSMPPRARTKSNWELLLELTDGSKNPRDGFETGSVASSVFTNNPVVGNQNNYYPGPQYYQQPPTQMYPGYGNQQAPPPGNQQALPQRYQLSNQHLENTGSSSEQGKMHTVV